MSHSVPTDVPYHCRVAIPNPGRRPDWVLYASTSLTSRLVVFVHGFAGKTVGTWQSFPESGADDHWWRQTDMLFVGYDSLRERPGETAAWLRERLTSFYPRLPDELLEKGDARIRPPVEAPYDELVLVGHSLGGFIVRLTLCQQARIWLFDERLSDPNVPRPPLLNAQVRLFSPASAGFEPAGLLGMLAASGCLWSVGSVALHRSPGFTALRRGSDLLRRTRDETEALVKEYGDEMAALRARILWARPEDVVERDGYETDFEPQSLAPERKHRQVCKPHFGYQEPRRFVQTGKHR
jgi:pimeloyl-ACP methyl ester carboxylesterase